MNKIVTICLFLFVFTGLRAQETTINDPNAEVRKVSSFRSIKVSDGIELFLSQGTEESVAVSATRDEYKSRIKAVVEEGVLKIYFDRESFSDWTSGDKKLKAYVSFRTLEKLTATSGSSVKIQGTIKEDALMIVLNSGAYLKGRFEAGKLVVEAESGARMDIAGAAGKLNVSVNSGAKVSAYDLAAGKADIRSTTGAKVEVKVDEEMKLYASTGGHIYYKGAEKITEIETKIGTVIKKKD